MSEAWETAVWLFALIVTSPVRFLSFIIGVTIFQWKAGYKNGRDI